MKFTKTAAVIMSGALLLTGCGKAADYSATVMNIGDIAVSAGLYDFYLNMYSGQMDDIDAAKELAVKQCKDNFLIVADAHAMGVELSEDTQKELDEYKQSVVDSYDGGYDDFLKENNITDEDVDKIISVSYYAEELQKQMDEQEITEEDKKDYFKNNYRRAKHILISTTGDLSEDDAKKKAEELLEKAQNGEDFDALIADNSEDPGSTANPDGYVFTDDEMVPEFQNGVDSIGVGEFTLVKSTYGYHVIQRLALDETPEYFETAYAEVADRIGELMESKRFEEQVHAWADEYGVEITTDDKAIDAVTKAAEDK